MEKITKLFNENQLSKSQLEFRKFKFKNQLSKSQLEFRKFKFKNQLSKSQLENRKCLEGPVGFTNPPSRFKPFQPQKGFHILKTKSLYCTDTAILDLIISDFSIKALKE
jgi:hypothetical protein